MRKIKTVLKSERFAAIILLVSVLFAAIPFSAVAEDEIKDYAEIKFGNVDQFVNMHDVDKFSVMSPVVRKGKEGRITDTNDTFWLGLDDKFMYDLPEDTPVDVTIEYFDEGTGHFCLIYDSHNPDAEFEGTTNNDIYKEAEVVYLQNTGEWKTYTYHIEDLRAANRIYNGDLRLARWSYNYGMSKEHVIFGSIKVTFSEYINPLKTNTHLGVTGNLMSDTDDTILHMDVKNKDPKGSVSTKVTATVYDTYDRVIEKIEDFSFDLEPLQEDKIQIPFTNPKKYGLYKIKGNMEIDYKSKGEKINQPFEVKFSVSHIFEQGEGSTDYGAAHQLVAYSMGDPQKVADVYKLGGLTYIRDDLGVHVGSWVDGRWILKEEAIRDWKLLRDNGIRVIAILGSHSSPHSIPTSEDDLKKYEQFVRDTATQLKGIIDIYEIWNEPNISYGNPTGATPEQYAELAKRVYRVLKEVDPECYVLGLSTAANGGRNIDYDWTKRVFAAGGTEAMDGLSIHPYEWSGAFRDKHWIESATLLHELMAEFGVEDKEVFITEFGFSTYIGGNGLGYTRQEQYQNHGLGRAIAKGYDLYDKYVFYCFADRARRDYNEENWGIIDWYQAKENPYAAKESFVAMTAYSYFINQHTDTKKIIEKDSVYAFNFYNNKLNKNVLFLQSNNENVNKEGGAKKAFKLGCDLVDVYDAFGNKIDTVYSDNGEYSFIITAEPQYIVGNFNNFEEAEYNSAIISDGIEVNGAGGDVISIHFTKTIDKDLTLKVENTVDVVENNGFVGKTAEIKIKVPDMIDRKIMFEVSAVDKDGKSCYAAEHTLNITHPLQITVATEPASEISSNQWRLKATVKNLCYSQPVSGKYKIEEPETVAAINTERPFKLAPQEEVVYYFTLPEKVNKSAYNIKSVAVLENGYREENELLANFTSAVYTETKPVIDGDLATDEWKGSWIGTDSENDVKEVINWAGPSDLSFSGNLMWDEENLYFLAIVNDDVHYTNPGDPGNCWAFDSIQVGFDDRLVVNSVETTKFEEIGITAMPGGGAALYRFSSYYDGNPAGIMENCDVVVKRHETYTVYECAIPWDELFYEDYVVDHTGNEKRYKFSVIANDKDDAGDGSWIGAGRGWIEYMAGIGTLKTVELFGDMNLKK